MQPQDLNPEAIQQTGREMVRALQVTLRTVRTHGWSNEASLGAIDALTKLINEVASEFGEFGIHTAGDHVFLDDIRLKADARGFGAFENLIHELNSRAVGSVFVGGPATDEHVLSFIKALLEVDEDQVASDPAGVLNQINAQTEAQSSVISVGPIKEDEVLPDEEDLTVDQARRERAKKAFFKAVTVARAVLTSSHLNKRLDLRHAKRVVQNMVDLMMDEEFSLVGMTTLKDYDNYTFYHSVNVCIFSLALGKRVGLNRAQLAELGVAAMMHDMGKTKVPVEILRKQGKFNAEELEVMKHHPEMGVRELVKMKGLSSLAFKSMVAAFEHHMSYDPKLAGYPSVRRPYRPHLIGRIVAIADCFDAMTTKRCYTPKAVTRDKALAFMVSQGGQKFDPILVKIFANLVGVFPVGTTVLLKSNRYAIVTKPSEDPSWCHQPTVKLLTNEAGIEGEFDEIDLHAEGNDEIVTAIDETTLDFDPVKYFAA